MAKKKYVKPMMVSEEFVPNEYVAACAWEEGAELTATCGSTKITIRLDSNQGGNVWQATPIDANGNSAGGTQMLYPISGTDNYAFCGSIYAGHTGSAVSGEYYPVSQIQGGVVGADYGHGTLCNDVLDTQTDAKIASWHHHLTNVKSKNAS